MTEMIFSDLLDNLEFPEIVAVLSAFINEKDQNGDEKYISELNVSKNVTFVLKELEKISEKLINTESEYNLYIGNDYKLYLDFIEPSYIWACGGTIHDVYANTTIYDGNFVKAILRINNICENLMDICKTIEKNGLYVKLEEYNKILIRDITTINSLYVK
jgi:antiviral helicase SKI2